MISWIVASHREDILSSVLLPSLAGVEQLGDEIIVIRDAPSITLAYAAGQARATQPIRCYIHHDVRVLDLATLREQLISWTGTNYLEQLGQPGVFALEMAGMVGVIGSTEARMPWWEGEQIGSVIDARMGRIGPGGWGPAAILDGLLLATRQRVEWDVEAPGWHGYDHDACAQMLLADHTNVCLANGHELVEHVTTGPTDVGRLNGWDAAVARVHARWSPLVST